MLRGEASKIVAQSPLFSSYGVAIDVGTTTLGARLYDVEGNLLAQIGQGNPQTAYGADVISRMEAALDGKGTPLAESLIQAIDAMLNALCKDAKIQVTQVDALVITGNTVMLHLLTRTDAEPMTHAPFSPGRLFGETVTAAQIGLRSVPESTPIFFPPCIGAFLGADLVCALLASGICEEAQSRMLADIGTNGEMALWHDGVLRVCSTAAGPAFEGVGISMGMRGETGAIDRVWLVNGNLTVHVIGEGKARGICGSGMIDALACLLQSERLDETGYLEEETVTLLPPVQITNEDIRMIQLAKSAICAGMQVLIEDAGIEVNALKSLLVAGGFGSYLKANNAEAIGLLPKGLASKTRAIGNAALDGASMILLDREKTLQAEALAKQAETIDLATSRVFADLFTKGMLFP